MTNMYTEFLGFDPSPEMEISNDVNDQNIGLLHYLIARDVSTICEMLRSDNEFLYYLDKDITRPMSIEDVVQCASLIRELGVDKSREKFMKAVVYGYENLGMCGDIDGYLFVMTGISRLYLLKKTGYIESYLSYIKKNPLGGLKMVKPYSRLVTLLSDVLDDSWVREHILTAKENGKNLQLAEYWNGHIDESRFSISDMLYTSNEARNKFLDETEKFRFPYEESEDE